MGAEKNVENHIKKSLEEHGYWYTKIYANQFTKKGIPDILATVNSQMVALEIKRPTGGKPTPIQIKNLTEIANNGGLAIITNDPKIVNKITTNDPKNIFYYQPNDTNIVSANEATKIWQHPNNGPTPREPYSVIIKGVEEN